jgi:transposase
MKTLGISSEFCLALDLAKRSAEAAVAPMGALEKDWKRFPTHTVADAPESSQAIADLLAWVTQATGPSALCRLVVVESTGSISRRFAVALNVTGRLPHVHIVNPARSKHFLMSLGVRDKTDRIDAAGLALYGARCNLRAPRELSASEMQLRELTRLRENCVASQTMWKNRLGEACDRVVRKRIEEKIAGEERALRSVERDIRKALKADPALDQQVRWIKQVKCLKDVSAITITGELGDLARYRRSEVTAVGGVFPKRFTSGDTVRRPPRLARGGGSHLRRVLYMAATSVFQSKGALREYAERCLARGMKKAQTIGALMRKLLLIARAVVCARGKYRPELIGRRHPLGQGETQMT